MKEYSEVFKALSEETRIRILALLTQQGECCVCDIMEICRIPQSRASRHLRILKNARLVTDVRHGTWVYYKLTLEPGPALEVLQSNHQLFNTLENEEIAARMKAWRQTKSNKETCS